MREKIETIIVDKITEVIKWLMYASSRFVIADHQHLNNVLKYIASKAYDTAIQSSGNAPFGSTYIEILCTVPLTLKKYRGRKITKAYADVKLLIPPYPVLATFNVFDSIKATGNYISEGQDATPEVVFVDYYEHRETPFSVTMRVALLVLSLQRKLNSTPVSLLTYNNLADIIPGAIDNVLRPPYTSDVLILFKDALVIYSNYRTRTFIMTERPKNLYEIDEQSMYMIREATEADDAGHARSPMRILTMDFGTFIGYVRNK